MLDERRREMSASHNPEAGFSSVRTVRFDSYQL
jgi:hypothetical protein